MVDQDNEVHINDLFVESTNLSDFMFVMGGYLKKLVLFLIALQTYLELCCCKIFLSLTNLIFNKIGLNAA